MDTYTVAQIARCTFYWADIPTAQLSLLLILHLQWAVETAALFHIQSTALTCHQYNRTYIHFYVCILTYMWRELISLWTHALWAYAVSPWSELHERRLSVIDPGYLHLRGSTQVICKGQPVSVVTINHVSYGCQSEFFCLWNETQDGCDSIVVAVELLMHCLSVFVPCSQDL